MSEAGVGRVLVASLHQSIADLLPTRLAFYGSYFAMAILASRRLAPRYDVVAATSPPLPVAMAGAVISSTKHAAFVMDVRDLWPAAARALNELSNPTLYRGA